jgi:uncharacterized lipoprotein YmbA
MKPRLKTSNMQLTPSRSRFMTRGSLLAVALICTACASSKPQSYYTLTAPSETAAISANSTPIFIELLTVAVPERLARPQMVLSNTGDNSAEIIMLEQHRWISSFDNELRDALANGIANGIGAIDVSKTGYASSTPAWRIAVQLRQFDAVENVQIDAALSWTIRRSDGANSASCQWSGKESLGSGIGSLAQGAQRVTHRAALAIAQHLAALAANQPPMTCRL